MEFQGKKVLIFAGPDFEDRELLYPYYRFQEGGAEVKIAGLGDKTYKGKYGLPVETDGRYEEFVNQTWDAIVVPGGWAPDKIRMNEAALEIIRKAMKAQVQIPVGVICHGGWVLASADVVNGRKLTSYPAIKHDLIHAGATWEDAAVVVDGNLVTSRTPADIPAFSRELCKLLIRSAIPV